MEKPIMNNMINQSPTNHTTTSLVHAEIQEFIKPSTIGFNVHPTHDHYVTAPNKPTPPHSFFDAIKLPFCHNWKAAAWNQFKKNQQIAVFSLPVPLSNLPSSARIFCSQLISEIKDADVPSIFEL